MRYSGIEYYPNGIRTVVTDKALSVTVCNTVKGFSIIHPIVYVRKVQLLVVGTSVF